MLWYNIASMIAILLLSIQRAGGFPLYKDLIPNGHDVEFAGQRWSAVGHDSPTVHPGCLGRFARNVFGQHFAEAGFVWTRELCLKDSDRDGRTNGQELGDPKCTWRPGAESISKIARNESVMLSHPGMDEAVLLKLSNRLLVAQTRALVPGELVKSHAVVRGSSLGRGGPRKTDDFRVARVVRNVHHQVLVAFRFESDSPIEVILPRTWIEALDVQLVNSSSAQTTALQAHHCGFAKPISGSSPLGNPEHRTEDGMIGGKSVTDGHVEPEPSALLQQWYVHNLLTSSCTDLHQVWLRIPVSQAIFLFVNIVVPLWAFLRWRRLKNNKNWPGLTLWKIWLATFLIGDVGISAGFHKHFTHRTYEARREVRWILALLGQLALQGDAAYWTAIHRTHHARCERPGDPHSPLPHAQRWTPDVVGANATSDLVAAVVSESLSASAPRKAGGFLHAHGGFTLIDGGYDFDYWLRTPDIRKDPELSWITEQGILSVVGLPLLSYLAFGADVTLFYLHIPQLLTWHAVQFVNSWTHMWGYAPYGDAMVDSCMSTNAAWLLAFSGGEIWHNNHHARPESATFQVEWWELDPAFLVVRLLEAVGLAWNVKAFPRMQPSYERPSSTEALKSLVGFGIVVFAWRQARMTVAVSSKREDDRGDAVRFADGPLVRAMRALIVPLLRSKFVSEKLRTKID